VQNHADALSRRPDYNTGEKDNENVVILPEHLFMNVVEILSLEQQVCEAQEEHKEQIERLQEEFTMNVIEGKVFYWGQLVVPDEEE
jgi:hypothetical protein